LVVSGECDSYHLSPSGKRAVVSTHGELFSVATGRGDVRRLTQTPGVRETQPRWSPDGKWIAFVADTGGSDEVWVCDEPAAGGKERRITGEESYSDSGAVWTPDGKRLVYLAGTDVGNIGQAGRSTAQIYAVNLSPEDKDPTDRDVDSEADAQRQQREQRAGGRGGRGPAADPADSGPAKVEVKIVFEGIDRRARQLTRSGDAVGSLAVPP